MALKLNSIPNTLFSYKANAKDDQTIGTGENKISRNKIIATGRLCTVEYLGNALSGGKAEKYKSRLNGFDGDYAALSKAHMDQKLVFCATMAYQSVGRSAPESAEAVKKDNSVWRDPVFLRTMAAIDQEIVSPLLFDVASDLNGMVLDLQSVPMGSTKEIVVESNEAFLWEDGAVGASHSATRNYLYNDVVTLSPKAYHCAGRIKWYQDIVNDDGRGAGRYYLAIIRGLQSKIHALTAQAFLSAANSTSGYVPSYLYFTGYSAANWASARTAAAVANGVRPGDLMAFGRLNALQAVLPTGTPSDAALTWGLGEEWFKNGFIAMNAGIPLYEVLPAMVPGTVNSTGTMIGLPDDQLYITARMGAGRAPVQGVIAEGWPITLEYTPDTTADFTIYINMTTLMDIKPVFANKIAIIDDVTLSGT